MGYRRGGIGYYTGDNHRVAKVIVIDKASQSTNNVFLTDICRYIKKLVEKWIRLMQNEIIIHTTVMNRMNDQLLISVDMPVNSVPYRIF